MGDYTILKRRKKASEKSHLEGYLWLIWEATLLLVLLLNLPLRGAHGQTVQTSLRCPQRPLNINLYEEVLAKQIELGVDTDTYSQIRVRVRLRQTGRTKNRTLVTGDDLLSGLSISQEGLLSTLSGSLAYTTTCDFPFVARVKIRATDISANTRLASSTESIITITSPGEFVSKGMRVVSESPTPTATATATPE